MDQRKAIGRLGERMAERYLRQKGYQILARNWSSRLGELDIIAQKDSTLIFVEVRTTRGIRFGYGFQSVDVKKQQKVKRLAQQYIQLHHLESLSVRFDVVSILMNQEREVVRIDHIPQAF